MVIDWDDLLSYTTTRSVTVRHRYLGLTYYSLLTAVLVYIFVIQIGFQKKYNVQLDVDGSIQANVQGVGAAALRPAALRARLLQPDVRRRPRLRVRLPRAGDGRLGKGGTSASAFACASPSRSHSHSPSASTSASASASTAQSAAGTG